jgi:hypothetical protein
MSTFRFSPPQFDKSLGSCRFQSCRICFLGSWSSTVPRHSPFKFMHVRSHILSNCNIAPPTVRQSRQLYEIDAECSITSTPNVQYCRLLYDIDAKCSISPTPTVRCSRLPSDIDAGLCSISSSPTVAYLLRLLYPLPASTTLQHFGFRSQATSKQNMPEPELCASPPRRE